ncbi:MAG: glutamate 5-kinase [Nitrospiraceae bacterium]|nr:glutamate 5-kinase [Nitrospiraceae bacterium]
MRLIVKIGSNILSAREGGLDEGRMRSLAADICLVSGEGNEVVVVSSGAIAAGVGKLGLKKKPSDIRLKQAAAAVGQTQLMWLYEKLFREKDKKVAQILLTRDVFTDRVRYINARNTIFTLIGLGVIPVINENDTVSMDEIRFGDNDQLAALVASLLEADRLVILSDVEGLFTADPRHDHQSKLIPVVSGITAEIEKLAGGAGSPVGTGGMYSKVMAAKKAMSAGITVNIINGKKKGLLPELIHGRPCGTEFRPGNGKLPARKGWIAYGLKAKGRLVIDEGAKEAILTRGKSLLPSGITQVEGIFDRGDPVYLVSLSGQRLAKGLSNYSSGEIERIKGRRSSEISATLGYTYSDEVVHRDNLVVVA